MDDDFSRIAIMRVFLGISLIAIGALMTVLAWPQGAAAWLIFAPLAYILIFTWR